MFLKKSLLLLVAGLLMAPSVRAQEAAGKSAVAGESAAIEDLGPTWFNEDQTTRIRDEGRVSGFGKKLLLYPINRVGDLLDVGTFQFGFGLGARLNFHATRAFQFGAGFSAASLLGNDRRNLGICTDQVAEFSVLPFTASHYRRFSALGHFKEFQSKTDMPWAYQKYRDYWGVGVELSALMLNFNFELHPVELVDGIVGITGFDILGDDLPRRWNGNLKTFITESEAQPIKRVVIVPSRVVREKNLRMERDGGVGVYFARRIKENHLGKLGEWMGSGRDRADSDEFSGYVKTKDFNIHRELLQRAERSLVVEMGWDVIDVGQTLDIFDEKSMLKKYKRQSVRRLPNYPGLVEWHGVDAILDVRVWEWGVWGKNDKEALMRLDVEYKLLDKTGQNVLFNKRFLAYEDDKHGSSLLDFAKGDGDRLIRESVEACDLVHAEFIDHFTENQ